MKRIFFIMFACCLLVAKSFGQEPEKDNPNAPEITFEATEHDFGKVLLNGLVEHEFNFTNTGKEPLIIHSCSASCGCTTPSCPKDPIKPGEKGTVKVKYNTTSSAGVFNKYVTVSSNAKNSSVRLSIKGEMVKAETEEAK